MNARSCIAKQASRVLTTLTAAAVAFPLLAQDTTPDADMSSMPGMHMTAHTPVPGKKIEARKASSSSRVSATPGGQSAQPMSSMPGMHHAATPPAQPVEMQQLDDGQMTGLRPASHGLQPGSADMSSMQGMHMPSMQGGNAPPNARSPDYSDGYAAGPMHGMDMHDSAFYGMLLLDQLEYGDGNHGNAVFVDGEVYYGTDLDKLWLKAEGEHSSGKLQELRTEALWNHAYATYFSSQLGLRHDSGEGPDRTWAAFGVQGLAPYWFETEATLYVGADGRTAARFQAEYEEKITQRLILQPKFEVNLYGRDDPQRGIGSGLSDAEFGLRLRYEIRRELAPYIGVVYRQRYGHTAGFARALGETANETQLVAGLHFWF